MGEHSPKRRKLEHNSSDEDEDIENEELEQESEESEEKSEENTKSKSRNPTLKSASKVNFEAVHAGGLYKTAMFKLQIDDLLADVRPNYEKYSSTINGKLHEIKALIESILDREPLSVSVIGWD